MGIKNTLLDLNNHLFEQMERLNDDDLSDEQLEKEIKRAKAMSGVAQQVVSVASLVLEATIFNSSNEGYEKAPRLLVGDEKDKTKNNYL